MNLPDFSARFTASNLNKETGFMNCTAFFISEVKDLA
jgi:hypothetical protein